MYSIGEISESRSITKRTILSETAQIFDPLGLLGPCTVMGKLILQKLWSYKLSWDDTIPFDLDAKWRQFRRHLLELNTMQIPRWVFHDDAVNVQIHGFGDASIEAYGACVYIRSVTTSGKISVRLLCSKTRVAPLKSITIPRLELCGALLLAQLVKKVRDSISFHIDDCFYWSDSTICLAWINTQPNRLQTFVQNRVSQIQTLTNPNKWNHISTKDNPADLLSRGFNACDLFNASIWWSAPSWLHNPREEWPQSMFQYEQEIPELKRQTINCQVTLVDIFPMKRYSNLCRLQRTMAFCLRFISNCKSNINNRKLGLLQMTELHQALLELVKISQRETFSNEINALMVSKPLDRKSRLLSLNPFVDTEGILRVGGRLELSEFDFDKKHPALLSNKHHLTYLIFFQEHLRLYHAGPQQLLFSVREQFWPLSGRNLARKIVHSCVRCFRIKPRQGTPIMGLLPKSRVSPAPPFSTVGIDYAGPFLIKNKIGRGAKTSKAYMCLFVCFITKAVHLELVGDLTKDAFIAAFRRFCARRGKPIAVYTDNGTNFVGAHAELAELATFFKQNESDIHNTLTNTGINWNFIPAFSPHFGGIWEAGVKAVKGHLKRVLGNATLTFEEFYTVLTEIESILNSRPIVPISSDPNDFNALTPSHFLIGRVLTSLPDPDVTAVPINRLSRYQLLQQIQQHFWKRWTREYISELQTRTKWKINQMSLKIGSLVVLRDDHAPPLKWKLGRIVSLHEGPDAVARVASIKTCSGIVKRSFSKICELPIEIDSIE